MKTTTNTLVMLLALTAGMAPAAAQDTIHSRALPANVYDVNWPDSMLVDSARVILSSLYSGSYYSRIGVLKYTDEPMKVYGIAASLVKINDWYTPEQRAYEALFIIDTVTFYDENLYLWQKNGNDFQQAGECLTVNMTDYSPQYYWDLGLIQVFYGTPYPVLPMFERYFQEPILVHDTFMVGKRFTNGLVAEVKPDERHHDKNWNVVVPTFLFIDEDENIIRSSTQIWYYYPPYKPPEGTESGPEGWNEISNGLEGWYVILFPIITPNPDTTREGIENLTPVERNTVVSPNPATGTVRVASGFGLQHIEVYDEAGRRVYDAEASGMQAHIDVGSWPRGAYTVHVRTAVGTAIKKLLVQ